MLEIVSICVLLALFVYLLIFIPLMCPERAGTIILFTVIFSLARSVPCTNLTIENMLSCNCLVVKLTCLFQCLNNFLKYFWPQRNSFFGRESNHSKQCLMHDSNSINSYWLKYKWNFLGGNRILINLYWLYTYIYAHLHIFCVCVYKYIHFLLNTAF